MYHICSSVDSYVHSRRSGRIIGSSKPAAITARGNSPTYSSKSTRGSSSPQPAHITYDRSPLKKLCMKYTYIYMRRRP